MWQSCIYFLRWVCSGILCYLKSNIWCHVRFDLNCGCWNNCLWCIDCCIVVLIDEYSWNVDIGCQITLLALSFIILSFYWNVFRNSISLVFIDLNSSNFRLICGFCGIHCYIRLFWRIFSQFNLFDSLFRFHIFPFILLYEVWCIFLNQKSSLLSVRISI